MLFTNISKLFYRKRIIKNLSNLSVLSNKPQQTPHVYQQQKKKHFSPIQQIKKQQNFDKELIQKIAQQINSKDIYTTKFQQKMNRAIKAQTNTFLLLKIFKNNYHHLTTRNLVNLLIKLIELREINGKKASEQQKFQNYLQSFQKKIHKMTPQDLISLLFGLKKIKISTQDLINLKQIIQKILKEFCSQTKSIVSESFESFYVVSMDSNVKLLHSLRYIYKKSGNLFQPTITELITGCIKFIYRQISLNQKKHQIRWFFYTGLIQMAGEYDLGEEIKHTFFVKCYNANKLFYHKGHQFLFELEDLLHSDQSLMTYSFQNIDKNYKIFDIHKYIYNELLKPTQIIKMSPLWILKHLIYLQSFTNEQIHKLEFKQIKNNTFYRIEQFLKHVLTKYYAYNYKNDHEKKNITRWARASAKHLPQIIEIYEDLFLKNQLISGSQHNKFINSLIEYFNIIPFEVKCVVVRLGIQRKFDNLSVVLEMLFDENKKVVVKHFEECYQFLKLFPHWEKMNQSFKFSVPKRIDKNVIKHLMKNSRRGFKIEKVVQLLGERIKYDPDYLETIVVNYIKFSEQNRFFGEHFYGQIQQQIKLKQSNHEILRNAEQDLNRTHPNFHLRKVIRNKMMVALQNFKIVVLLLEKIVSNQNTSPINLTSTTLMKQLLFHFNEEIKCLNFVHLITLEQANIIVQLDNYFKKSNFQSGTIAEMAQSPACFKVREQQEVKNISMTSGKIE